MKHTQLLKPKHLQNDRVSGTCPEASWVCIISRYKYVIW